MEHGRRSLKPGQNDLSCVRGIRTGNWGEKRPSGVDLRGVFLTSSSGSQRKAMTSKTKRKGGEVKKRKNSHREGCLISKKRENDILTILPATPQAWEKLSYRRGKGRIQ